MNEVKWGIIGAGNIANKFAEDIKLADNSKLIACSSKDPAKADNFMKRHKLEHAYGSYDEMLRNDAVDAVYISTTHNFHFENALLCIKHGKNVLCEKPFTMNALQAEQVFEKANEKKVFVMEGMWTRFLPVTTRLNDQIKNGEIGKPMSVFAEFGVKFPYLPESRAFNMNLAGGGLLDLGIYAISFACNIFGNHPVKIESEVKMGQTGVDEEARIVLTYSEGRTATLRYSMMENYKNSATITGTKGDISVDSVFMPSKTTLKKSDGYSADFENTGHNGFEFEIQAATDMILQGELQSPVIRWTDTVEMLRICDTLRSKWNFKYPEEK